MRRYEALKRKMDRMRDGYENYYTYNFFSNYGFLPNYAFPSIASLLTMYNREKREYKDNWRSAVIAIKEFAPFNLVYYMGNKYKVNSISINFEKEGFEEKRLYICDKCNEIVVDAENKEASTLVACPSCNEQINLNAFKKAVKFPNMFSQANDRITCDEENREITGYDISINYQKKESAIEYYEMNCENAEPVAITYEHNGEIFMVNKGVLVKDKKTLEIENRTFNFCSACGSWLSTAENVQDHIEKCAKGGSSRQIFEDLWLFVRGNHDIITFTLPIEDGSEFTPTQVTTYYTTMKEAIILSIVLTYNLEENEIQGFLNPLPGKKEQQIVIFESEEGGTGVFRSLLNPDLDRFDKFIENMIHLLHVKSIDPYEETSDACKEACYNCLLTFRNQREHFIINRTLVIPLIKKMNGCSLSKKETQSVEDTGDKYEYLKGKCESQLEILVLDEMVQQKLDLPTDAQKVFFESDVPIAKADFYYDKGSYGIYIFVDGPPHAAENIQDADYEKRTIIEDKYGNPVVVLSFTDGEYINNHDLIGDQVKKLIDYL